MKRIITAGLTYPEPLQGSGEWYFGMDYTGGDLYEVEADSQEKGGFP